MKATEALGMEMIEKNSRAARKQKKKVPGDYKRMRKKSLKYLSSSFSE